MTTEPVKVKDKLVLRVTSVERGGPAEKAGLEIGDVVFGVNDTPLTGPEQLDEVARRGESMTLAVMDVRTGRAAQIELRVGPRDADAVAKDAPKADTPTPAAPPRSLGISAEPVSLGQRTALKVIRVEPGSPAAKAGLEPNDVVVAANGAAITGPEQLATALRKSGPTMTLTVRDSRTGKDTDVDVALGGTKPAAPVSVDTSIAGTGSPKSRFGAVTELAFYDVEAAVKITEIEPGSPAARAGLAPGILILQANGKPVLHPNDLNDAIRTSTGTLKLTVVDPRQGRKGTVDVNLGG
jgi:S1-C subfamily serine protease